MEDLIILYIIIGIILFILGIIFLFRPKTHFVINTNPEKTIEDIKNYKKTLTKNKIKTIKIIWSIIGFIGIIIIIYSLYLYSIT